MKVFVTDSIAEDAIELLRTEHEVTVDHNISMEDLAEVIPQYDALLVRSRTKVHGKLMEAAMGLTVIGRAGIGVDNIDVASCSDRGVAVVNAPAGSTESVAELTVGHMLALSRFIARGDRTTREGGWEKKKLKGVELMGKTLGLIGIGRIGCRVAEICRVFPMQVIGTDPMVTPEQAAACGVTWMTREEVFAKADYISLHVPLIDSTRGMVNSEVLASMKDSAYLINCARGGVVDESALYDALKDGVIAGAALDVFSSEPPGESPLLTLDNFIASPHIGANTREAQSRAGTITAEQVMKVLRGDHPDFCVNCVVFGE